MMALFVTVQGSVRIRGAVIYDRKTMMARLDQPSRNWSLRLDLRQITPVESLRGST